MTSIYDLPYRDIEEFLLANDRDFYDENQGYNMTLDLLKDKKAKGHTMSIIEWMMAHNLLICKVNIPNYTTSQINKMSQNEINNLAKLLKMNGNNIENIKNILRYLHKLDNKNVLILPEIDDIILQNLIRLEGEDLNFDTLKINDVINLLKTHRNKALIRKLVYNNLEKILFYNFLIIDTEKFDDLWYFRDLSYDLPKSVVLKLLEFNEKRLIKDYSIEERNKLLDDLDESEIEVMNGVMIGVMNVELYRGIEDVSKFLINLIEINETFLAKKVFDIANKYGFRGQLALDYYTFNQYLIHISAFQKDDIFNVLLNFMGEKDFFNYFEKVIIRTSNTPYIKLLLDKFVKLQKYELFMEIIDLLISKDYKGSKGVLNMMFPRLQKAIESNNNNLFLKYLNIVNLALDNKIRLGNDIRLRNINKLIEDAERDES